MRTPVKTWALLLLGVAASNAALAHSGMDSHVHTSFVSGWMHPFSGLDHLLVMLTVGLWCGLVARQPGRELLWGPLGFTNMMLVGTTLGLQGVEVSGVEPMLTATVVVAGLLVVTRMRLQGAWAALLAGLFAVFHGLAHGYELADNVHAFEALAGMVCATAALQAAGMALGWKLRGVNVWVARLLGATVAVAGSALLLPLA